MGDSKVFLSGSFTEGESRTWVSNSSDNAEKTVAKEESRVGSLSFGSVNPLGGLSFGNFICESGTQPSSSKGPIISQPSHTQKDSKPNIFQGVVQENGAIYNPIDQIPLSNGNKETKIMDGINIISLCISENDPSNKSVSLIPQEHSGIRSVLYANGMFNKSSPVKHVSDSNRKVSQNPVVAFGDWIPRGLINSGNLCFLNVTLQALLSCVPFVQLIQGLRMRNFPKVGYPTITAFAEFVTTFDKPSEASGKKTGVTVLQTG